MSRRPPNLLLIHSDQHRFDCLGVNGHPFLQTPNLNALAGGGVNFTHAFTPVPICSPARASLLTGTYPTTHGCLTIPHCCETFTSARPDLPLLTRLLESAGYRNTWVGKFHAEVQGGPTDHGVVSYTGTHDYRKWRASQGIPPQPRNNALFGETDPHITPEQSTLAWQADRVIADLRASAATGKPFFCRWDPPEPHLPNLVPEPYASMYPPESIPPWPSFPDPLTGKPPAQRRSRQRWLTDDWPWEKWAPVVSRYLGEITLLDHQLGRLLTELDRLGLTDNTLVLYSADHGDMCGAHGMMDKHYNGYDDILRVPLLARWPGVLPAGATCDAFVVNEIDLAATLLTAAGITLPPSFIGQDLTALALGQLAPRDAAFSQYFGTQQGLYSMRALRTRRWKYVYHPTAFDELYDLEADPAELTNLIDHPAHQPTLQALRHQMTHHMTPLQDPLPPPTWHWPQ